MDHAVYNNIAVPQKRRAVSLRQPSLLFVESNCTNSISSIEKQNRREKSEL